MEYIEMLEESVYRYEVMKRQLDTQEFLKECVAIAEGTDVVSKIEYIHEATNDKAQSFWSKFTAWIAGIWNRFLTRADKFFKNDVAFLTENKEIILGKKLQEGTITMASNIPECIKRLQGKINIVFPNVTFIDDLTAAAANDGTEGNKDKWRTDIQNFVTNKTIKIEKDQSFADACKAYYCPGPDQDVPTSSINMADLYNFCISANTFRTGILKTKDSFDKWMAKAEKAYNSSYKKNAKTGNALKAKDAQAFASNAAEAAKKANENKAKPVQSNAKPQANTNNTGGNNNANQPVNASTELPEVYSVVFESYINEAKINFNSNTNSEPNGKYVNKNSTYNNNRNGIADAGASQNAKNDTVNAANNATANMKNGASQQIKDAAANQAYTNVGNAQNGMDSKAIKAWTKSVAEYCQIVTETVGTVIGAMCTGAEKITREYMSVISAHVMSYSGKVDSNATDAGTQTAQTTTNMNAGGSQNVSNNSIGTPGL